MRLYRLEFAARAVNDLAEIEDHVAATSPLTAPKVVDRIIREIQTLTVIPHRTRLRQRSPKGDHILRKLPCKPYVVYFSVDEADAIVRVLHVRHGARRRPRFGRDDVK